MPRRRKKATTPETIELPALPIRDTVLFPRVVTSLPIGRERSIRLVEDAVLRDRTVVVVAQRDPEKLDPEIDDIYYIGTEAVIGRVLKLPDGSSTALIQGQRRMKLVDVVSSYPYLTVRATPVEESAERDLTVEALMRAVLSLFEKCVKLSPTLLEEHYIAAMNADEPGPLADLVASALEIPLSQKQEILEAFDPSARLKQVSVVLARELSVLELQDQIHHRVQEEVDKSQREYFLREQLKVIQHELANSDPASREAGQIRVRLQEAGLPEVAQKKANEEIERLALMPAMSPEVSVVRTYLDWLATLPWQRRTDDNLDVERAGQILEEHHYGLPRVKERILEYIAVRSLAGHLRSPILCFVGPPGVGKTSLGRSIALALGRKFVRVSLGGIRDEAEIRGHRRTYIGAMPGRILQTMRQANSVNPLFMLDEVDKLGADFRGDPSSALLEVLDPEQNHAFSDHYLEVPYSLSQVLFIATANLMDPIPPALQDRMEVIEIAGYTEAEKLAIARRFLVPKQLAEHGLSADQIRFSEGALERIIRAYTREAGVRNLEREIATICRKVARLVAEGKRPPRAISPETVERFLGVERYFWGAAEEHDEVGVATGVVWTERGGDILSVEVALVDGRGHLNLTGHLGDVMKESAQAALTYARSQASVFGIKSRVFDRTDVHVHVPAGAIPKDGPSAGITMATAIISALTGRAVRRDVAMTGEVTLRGRVLPVGGLKEKVLAAHRAGMRTFVLPRKNEKDLTEVPAEVRNRLEFVFVQEMSEVLSSALV
ncbi:MAG: endopeptidase La [Chloroflexi bacterium]|nr:endopeptidase La [Chloroflexota bacterium]